MRSGEADVFNDLLTKMLQAVQTHISRSIIHGV